MGSAGRATRFVLGHPIVVGIFYVLWFVAAMLLALVMYAFFASWYAEWISFGVMIEDKRMGLMTWCPDEREKTFKSVIEVCQTLESEYISMRNRGALLLALEKVFQSWELCGDLGCIRYFGNTAVSLVFWVAVSAVSVVAFMFLIFVCLRWFAGWATFQRGQFVNLPTTQDHRIYGSSGYPMHLHTSASDYYQQSWGSRSPRPIGLTIDDRKDK
jgi:hypothetical protein